MRFLAATIVVLLVLGVLAYADRAFLTPRSGRPVPADAIVVLGGEGEDTSLPQRLALEGYSTTIAYSVPRPTSTCLAAVPGRFRVICFHPRPVSTQGEAREVGALARQYGWHRILVVSGHAQARRARLRVERCFTGQIVMTPAPAPVSEGRRFYDVAYEVAATLKAQLWQRGC